MLHACDFCTRVRWLAYSPLARRRCPAQVCIPAMARRARVTCTCGSCLAVRVLAARDCISPVADTHCVRLRLAADAVSPNVVQFVFSLRATASRPSPILAARNYVVFLRPVDKLSVPPRKRICNTKKIEGDNITGRLWAVWAEI